MKSLIFGAVLSLVLSFLPEIHAETPTGTESKTTTTAMITPDRDSDTEAESPAIFDKSSEKEKAYQKARRKANQDPEVKAARQKLEELLETKMLALDPNLKDYVSERKSMIDAARQKRKENN